MYTPGLSVFHPLTLLVSDQGLLVAVTKTIGYWGMIIISIALVVSTGTRPGFLQSTNASTCLFKQRLTVYQ